MSDNEYHARIMADNYAAEAKHERYKEREKERESSNSSEELAPTKFSIVIAFIVYAILIAAYLLYNDLAINQLSGGEIAVTIFLAIFVYALANYITTFVILGLILVALNFGFKFFM